MGRRAMRKRQEPAQKIQLLLAKPGNVADRLSPSQNRRKAQKQDFVQGIHHLAALAMIRQILEMIKKYNSLRKVQLIVHRNPSKRIRGIRQIQHFTRLSSGFFTRLPWARYARAGRRSRFRAGSSRSRARSRSRTRRFIRPYTCCRTGNCARKSLACCVKAASCAATARKSG